MKNRICVLSVDDHPLIREGIATLVNGQPDMQVVAQASNGHETDECFGRHRPDITLMDLRLPDANGIDAVIALRTHHPDGRMRNSSSTGARTRTTIVPQGDELHMSPDLGQQIVLDIKDLTLFGQSDIDFLARCEAAGIKLMNCARYVRDWIARQQGGK